MNRTQLVQHCIDYIEDHLQDNLSATQVAARVGFSPYHFDRIFQQVTGMSITRYILRRRLLHGIYHMEQGSTGLDAAVRYGFDTYAGFYRAFCREFGCPPVGYLRAHRVRCPYRIDLEKEAQPFVTHSTATRILRLWKLESEPIADVYDAHTGRTHENACYVGEKYVLKYTPELSALQRNNEAGRVLVQAGLPAAVPIATRDGRQYVYDNGLYYYVTDRLSGQSVSAGDFYDGDFLSRARFIGTAIGQLHLVLARLPDCGSDMELPRQLRLWAMPAAQQALGLSEDFSTRFLEDIDALYPTLPRQVIHRDPNPGNIICSGDRWGLIDFDLAQCGARIFDPCYAATAILSEHFGHNDALWPEVLRSILLGYHSVIPLTMQERKAIPFMLLSNQFLCVAYFARYEKFKPQYTRNLHITRWLLERMDELSLTGDETQ